MGYAVYKHTNNVNGKIYIGMTNNTKRRWRLDGIEYRPDKGCKPRPFWNAICKYGWSSFNSEIIADNLTREEAVLLEVKLIKELKSNIKGIGYNVASGGNGGRVYKVHTKGMLGKKHSDDLKRNHKKHMLNKENNPMYNGKTIWGVTHDHPRGMLGKKHTDEHKKHISELFSRGKHPNAKKLMATLNEQVIVFDCFGDCCDYFNISNALITKLLKSGDSYVLSKTKKNNETYQKIVGLKIEYYDLENTEVS